MIRLALFVLLLCINYHCEARRHVPSDFEILTQVAWHEARGESSHVQQLVLAVVRKRATMSHKSLHKVVTEKGQFPWARKLKTWKLTPEQAEWGFQVLSQPRVVTEFVYFNTIRHDFGKKTKKIGNLYFSE